VKVMVVMEELLGEMTMRTGVKKTGVLVPCLKLILFVPLSNG